MQTPNPNDAGNFGEWFHQWALALGAIFGSAVVFVLKSIPKMLDGSSPEAKSEKQAHADTKRWLLQQDRRVQEVVDRTDKRNLVLSTRIEELEADVERERQSGMGHYQHSARLYKYIIKMNNEWEAGNLPPDKIPDFDDI